MAHRPRMVCLDIDGTTINHARELSPAVQEAVQAVADAGVHVVMATGRACVATMPIIRALGIEQGRAFGHGAGAAAVSRAANPRTPM